MSYDSYASGAFARSLIARFGFAHALTVTIVLVAATILLGVATKAAGAGLACDANWPLCDGGLLNLFPANFPSFFEWIHRVVAMVAGVFIVGAAVAAWRGAVADRRITWAVTLGMVLTPIQVYLGRETVLSYEMAILNLHFWVAIVIFVLFAVATVLVWSDRLTPGHASLALWAAAATLPVHVVLSPVVIDGYSTVIQTLQYAVTLALLFAIVLAAIVGRRHAEDRLVSGVLSVTPLLALLVVYFGRESVMDLDPAIDLLYLGVAVVAFATFPAAAWLTRRTGVTAVRS